MMTLSEIASRLGLALQGDDAEIRGVNTLEAAGPDEVSFLANPKYSDLLTTTHACAVIVRPEHADSVKRALVSEHPYQDFGRVLHLFSARKGGFTGISPLAFIHPTATLGENVTVYPFVYIEADAVVESGVTLFSGCYLGSGVRVGQGTTLYPNVTLMDGVTVGAQCLIHAGAVIGSDGFGFVRTEAGIEKIPQVGKVVLGNDVEVGANTTIDRAVLDVTRIGDGTKIDNLVQVGHNVHVGRNTFLVAQVGISGSTHIGDGCTLAGQVGVAGHLSIGNNVTIGPQSGVPKDIPDGMVMGGSPAVDQQTYMRTLALMPRYPELFKRLSRLEKALERLQRSDSDRNDV